MELDLAAKREVLRGFTYGAYVVGTRGEGPDDPCAFLATWVTQASFEPPLVSVCIRVDSTPQERIEASGVFSVNLLPADGADVARDFVSQIEPEDGAFGEYAFRPGETGAPLLDLAVGFVECRVAERHLPGDHGIYVGEVVRAGVGEEGEPLTLAATGMSYGG